MKNDEDEFDWFRTLDLSVQKITVMAIAIVLCVACLSLTTCVITLSREDTERFERAQDYELRRLKETTKASSSAAEAPR